MQWHSQDLWERLEPLLPGLSIEVVARTASTSTDLLERIRAAGAPGTGERVATVRRSVESRAFAPDAAALRRRADLQPCLLVAEQQTAGRGRQGRPWHSAPGASLTFSLALPLAPPDWSGLSLAVGVALAEALQPARDPLRPWLALKWPNDLWLVDAGGGGRKLGGVLIETVAAGARRLAVIGIGLNVQPLPADPGRAPACLQEIDPAATPPGALACVAEPLVRALQQFEREGFAAFAGRFAARDLLAGRAVTLSSPGTAQAPSQGLAEGVAANGGLRVRTPAGVQTVTSGEVSVRPVPTPRQDAR